MTELELDYLDLEVRYLSHLLEKTIKLLGEKNRCESPQRLHNGLMINMMKENIT